MKPVIGICLAAASLFACNPFTGPADADTRDTPVKFQVADSLYARETDKAVDTINSTIRTIPIPHRILLPYKSEKDSMFAWLAEDHTGIVQAVSYSGDSQLWPTFFYLKGTLHLVRYREWHDPEGEPFIRESKMYYRDGKPVYCEERSMKGPKGAQPYMLKSFPHHPSQRPLDSIALSYAEFWPLILKVKPELAGLQHP